MWSWSQIWVLVKCILNLEALNPAWATHHPQCKGHFTNGIMFRKVTCGFLVTWHQAWPFGSCHYVNLLTENDFSITLSLPLPPLYDWFQLVFCKSIKKLQLTGIHRGLLQSFSAYDSKNKPFNISLDITRMVNKTTTSLVASVLQEIFLVGQT